MDAIEVLKNLFEKHFRTPATRIQPLQGELGGSGRRIIRLSAANASVRDAFLDALPEWLRSTP